MEIGATGNVPTQGVHQQQNTGRVRQSSLSGNPLKTSSTDKKTRAGQVLNKSALNKSSGAKQAKKAVKRGLRKFFSFLGGALALGVGKALSFAVTVIATTVTTLGALAFHAVWGFEDKDQLKEWCAMGAKLGALVGKQTTAAATWCMNGAFAKESVHAKRFAKVCRTIDDINDKYVGKWTGQIAGGTAFVGACILCPPLALGVFIHREKPDKS